METRILRVENPQALGSFTEPSDNNDSDSSSMRHLKHWQVPTTTNPPSDLENLREAARLLRTSDIPVGFPTETVYGLGADATRSGAVRGIYAAKNRPQDNPLIVHISDLAMLHGLLNPSTSTEPRSRAYETAILAIYHPLISRFWPGPLTILLPNPPNSRLAPEVTAGLGTFGARMPASPLARTLIALADTPLAAPSANASTRPSPTAAAHVVHDLAGRIELVVDGGQCGVGVESTVVDGLCDPPVVLRPGGVGIEELRSCKGWEGVRKAYRDEAELGAVNGEGKGPRAPGMKYKHYSPKARVVLYEAGASVPSLSEVLKKEQPAETVVGIVRTRSWNLASVAGFEFRSKTAPVNGAAPRSETNGHGDTTYEVQEGHINLEDSHSIGAGFRIFDINIGSDARSVAQGLFSALRELDEKGAQVIFIEGIDDREDIAAAVMNRLRKAASEIRTA